MVSACLAMHVVRGEVSRDQDTGQVRTLTHYVADGETRCNMKVRRGEVNGCAVLIEVQLLRRWTG